MNVPLPPQPPTPGPKPAGQKIVWVILCVLLVAGFVGLSALGFGAYWFFKATAKRVQKTVLAVPTPVQVERGLGPFTPPPLAVKQPSLPPIERAQRMWPAASPAPAPGADIVTTPLYRNGAFGFPQSEAQVVCDRADLRFSVWSNSGFLFAQAIVWGDGDPVLGRTSDGREIGDNSVLSIKLVEGSSRTPDVDRDYMLNPWPSSPGLRYVVSMKGGNTGILGDTAGLGAIRYETLPTGQRVRVDTYLIPLAEIGKKTGDRIEVAFWAKSPQPDLWLSSTAHAMKRNTYSFHVPVQRYHAVTLQTGHAIDVNRAPTEPKPASRAVRGTAPSRTAGTPRAESTPPLGAVLEMKFTALDGRQVDLTAMRGKVVLIDFWATWCGPCIAELPRVLDAYGKLHDRGFEIVGISFDSDRAKLETMLRQKGMTWPQFFDGQGWKNQFGQQYGIRAIPTMWLVDKQGRLASRNARADLAAQVEKLLSQ